MLVDPRMARAETEYRRVKLSRAFPKRARRVVVEDVPVVRNRTMTFRARQV
jgi:hypothetical protein